jgi:hypothetical protein
MLTPNVIFFYFQGREEEVGRDQTDKGNLGVSQWTKN